MSRTNEPERRRPWLAAVFWLALGLAAAARLGFDAWMFGSPDETVNLEATLAFAAAGQILEGPGTLYGPFSRSNPRVLLQAPLYYRLTGLGAWLLGRAGVHPVPACYRVGRALSLLAFGGVLAIAAALARLGGASRRAGAWAALLVAASPLIDGYAITVRPDMAAMAFQGLGLWLVLRTLGRQRPSVRLLAAAYASFALAACMKQHDVVAAGFASALLARAWWRGRAWRRPIELAHLLGLAIVLGYYGAEEVATGGMMSRSVFLLPARFGRLDPGSWSWLGVVSVEAINREFGLLVLALACLAARPRPGPDSRPIAGVGRLDRALGWYLVAELIVMAWMCLNSRGAWVNYAIAPVVVVAVRTGRALDAIAADPARSRRAWAVGLAALVLLGWDLRETALSGLFRVTDRWTVTSLFDRENLGPGMMRRVYFLGYPKFNQLFGRPELVHDEWLYGLYEKAGAAEPRSRWLRAALVSGPIRAVVVPVRGAPLTFQVDPPRPPGLAESLPELGYEKIKAVGRYEIWGRRRAPRSGSTDDGTPARLMPRKTGR